MASDLFNNNYAHCRRAWVGKRARVQNNKMASDSFKVFKFSLLVGRQEGHPACKNTELWGAGMVIRLERGGDLHMAQRIPLPLTVSCFSKVQTGFTFLVPAHPGGPGQRAVKRVCVCVV